jgi:hypothetical protein
VIENDGSAGLTILAPSTGNCNLYKSTGSGGLPRRALMRYHSSSKTLVLGTSVSDGALQLLSGEEEPALDIDGDRNATFAGNVAVAGDVAVAGNVAAAGDVAVAGNVAVAGDRVGIETMKTHGSIGAGVAGDIVWAKDASNHYYIFVSDGTLWNGLKLTETSS